jgi:hypothetical protein
MKYIYNLKDNSGEIEILTSNLQVSKHGRFRYDNKSFQVYEFEESADSVNFSCREIEDEAFYGNYAVNIRKLGFEERLTDFLAKRNFDIKPNTLTEESFKGIMLDLLSPKFHIREEVWGKHFSGRKMKIDAILTPKENDDWRNKSLSFGIEFKNPIGEESNHRRDTDCLAQCLDYTFTKFDEFEDTFILLCPLLPGLENESKLLRFISTYNLGYVDFYEDKILFKYGLQMLWEENGKTPSLLRKSMLSSKYGNRGYKLQ